MENLNFRWDIYIYIYSDSSIVNLLSSDLISQNLGTMELILYFIGQRRQIDLNAHHMNLLSLRSEEIN